jgi:hypothetical protein
MLHPTIGWPLERLLLHLEAASDQAAVLSPSEELRRCVVERVREEFGAQVIERPQLGTADGLWPAQVTTWVDFRPWLAGMAAAPPRAGLPYAAVAFPKLSIVLDAKATSVDIIQSQWSAIVRQPGRGPTLRLQLSDEASIEEEVFAAIDSVWPI